MLETANNMNFKNWLDQNINEIKSLAGVDPERDLLFNNIFSDKLRMLVPLDSNEELQELTKLLEDLGYTVNYEDLVDKKIIYKKIKTKEGEKNRPEKVGKALQSAISFKTPFSSKAEELLDWWQKNSSHLKNTQTGASIIISRSPIDLVRMSDHDNITSCHDPKKSHFQCAKQEARTGGAIAYVVKNSDLVGVDLQKPELFKDKDRKIDGIVPLERLRLRRFNKGEIDLLAPELRTYGTSHIGFYDAVKNWSKSAQADVIKDINPEEDYENFDLRGGTYQDTDANKIWGEFFGKKFNGDDKTSKDEKEELKDSVSGDDLHEAAERQIREHSANWKHFHVYHDVTDDFDGEGGAYLSYGASVSFTIPARETTDKFKKAITNWRDSGDLKKVIEKSIDIYTISDINWGYRQEGKKEYHVVNLTIDEWGRHRNQLTALEHFLDYIDDSDRNYENNVQNVYAELIKSGHMRSPTANLNFINFKVDEDEGDITINSNPDKIGYLKDYPIDGPNSSPVRVEREYDIHLNTLKDEIFNNPSIKAIPFIDPKSIVLYMPKNTTQGWYTGETRKLTGYVYIKFSNSFKHLDYDNKSRIIAQIKQLDKNWDTYMSRLSQIFDLTVKGETEKRNKTFGYLPKIAKPKPEYTQTKIDFKDFVKNKDV